MADGQLLHSEYLEICTKSPVTDQMQVELIKGGEEILLSAIHKLINSIWNKEELP
jgi:hypothetical protein